MGDLRDIGTQPEPEPSDVAALLSDVLGSIADEKDPVVRYLLLTKEQVLYTALTARLADERARVAAGMSAEGMSYAQIAAALNIHRSRAQQSVERGRRLGYRPRKSAVTA